MENNVLNDKISESGQQLLKILNYAGDMKDENHLSNIL